MKGRNILSISTLALVTVILLSGCIETKKNKESLPTTELSETVPLETKVPETNSSSDFITEEIPVTDSFLDIENENYEDQILLCNDLTSLKDGFDSKVTYPLFFFEEGNNEELYEEYKNYSDQVHYLSQFESSETIVEELNNLYVLSQTPMGLPEDVWNHYFGSLDALKADERDSFYETYIDLATFVHDKALEKNKDMTLDLNKEAV